MGDVTKCRFCGNPADFPCRCYAVERDKQARKALDLYLAEAEENLRLAKENRDLRRQVEKLRLLLHRNGIRPRA